MHILVVEDDPVLSDGLRVGLSLFGATLDTVSSIADGRAALALTEAVVIFTSGLFTLNRLHFVGSDQASLNETGLVAIGLVTGFGSSLTGTGGALILIPILLFAHIEVKQALGLAQAIQVPIGVVASVVNFYSGCLDLALGSLIAVAVGAGVLTGAAYAHRSSSTQLKFGSAYRWSCSRSCMDYMLRDCCCRKAYINSFTSPLAPIARAAAVQNRRLRRPWPRVSFSFSEGVCLLLVRQRSRLPFDSFIMGLGGAGMLGPRLRKGVSP